MKWRISVPLRSYSKIGPNNFEASFAGNGKMRIFLCSDETPRLNAAVSGHVRVFSYEQIP